MSCHCDGAHPSALTALRRLAGLDLIEPVPVPLGNVLVAGGHSRKVAPCLKEPLAGEKVRERPGAKLLREAG